MRTNFEKAYHHLSLFEARVKALILDADEMSDQYEYGAISYMASELVSKVQTLAGVMALREEQASIKRALADRQS